MIDSNPESGQVFETEVQKQTQLIMDRFLAVLPSNYVSQINGPWYTLQFQSAAEQLANFIVNAQAVYKDADYAFTRTDFLWQILGVLIFPKSKQEGMPQLDGDVQFREFLQKMVVLLLQGATKDANVSGLEALTTADVQIIERYLESQKYGIEDQFIFDVLVSNNNTFPSDPFAFTENAKKVLTALRPAHTLYDLRFLFTEAFGFLFEEMSWEMDTYHYDDFRKYWDGVKHIQGQHGIVLAGRTLFSDPTRSFQSIQANSLLTIEAGSNKGAYRVSDVLCVPVGTDTIPRAYSTYPTGLTGTATVSQSNTITDPLQDWTQAVEGEILTFSAGPNVDVGLRLGFLLGANGGPIGYVSGSGDNTQVQLSPTLLRLATRMPSVGDDVSYSVDVDRLGVKVPRTVLEEDVSEQFYL